MNNTTANITSAEISLRNLVKDLYETYSKKLFVYTTRTYGINEDDATSLVYKTIYRVAEVYDNYKFDNEFKKQGFIYKTHLNYLRNYFRDNKSFEKVNREIELQDLADVKSQEATNPKLTVLQMLLERMEDWQRILLLLRSQEMAYSEIATFVNKPEKQLKVYYSRLKKQLLTDINKELKRIDHEKSANK